MMSTWLFVLRPYGGLVVDAIKSCMPKPVHLEDVDDAASHITFADAVAAGKIVGLTTYDPRANPAYTEALLAMTAQPEGDEAPAAVEAEEKKEEAAFD